jgi:putative zinc finger/helix-turn-helix YgiT family protein
MPAQEKEGQGRRCPTCGHQPLEPRKIRDEFDYGPDDDRVHIVAEGVPVLVCPSCGETLYGPEADKVRHDAICRALGLLTPDQIREVWERHGMNKTEFARLTGIGVATLARWEKGRLIQTRFHDRSLRVLAAFPEAIGFLQRLGTPSLSPAEQFGTEITADMRTRAASFQLYGRAEQAADKSGNDEPTSDTAPVREKTSAS